MSKFRFHVVGLPNAPTHRDNCWCAYNGKLLKFCTMMSRSGHEVIHYGVDGSDVECSQHRTILTQQQHKEYFGEHNPKRSYSPVVFDSSKPYWQIANEKAAYWIRRLAEKGDFVCLVGGCAQKPIADALRDVPVMICEPFVGYYGTFTPYRAFESYGHMHHCYGRDAAYYNEKEKQVNLRDVDGKHFDAVIPNYFDLEDFTCNLLPKDYFLYMGRMVSRKGIEVAVEATRRAGKRLVLCGQGVTKVDGHKIHTEDNRVYEGKHLQYVGTANVEERDELMRDAAAILVPTIYLEPFGGVAVEAMLCGTPAITSDWGAFPETVQHGKTGYRCRTLEQFVWAVENVHAFDRQGISDYARANYSLERVGRIFEEWFDMLSTLWGKGWYEYKQREQLDWLNRTDYIDPEVTSDFMQIEKQKEVW